MCAPKSGLYFINVNYSKLTYVSMYMLMKFASSVQFKLMYVWKRNSIYVHTHMYVCTYAFPEGEVGNIEIIIVIMNSTTVGIQSKPALVRKSRH